MPPQPRNAWGYQKLDEARKVSSLWPSDRDGGPGSTLNYKRITFCCLSHPVCTVFLQQAQETNTDVYTCQQGGGIGLYPASQ